MATRECALCNSIFVPTNKGQRFCSPKCYGESRRGEKRGHYKPPTVRVCPKCGKTFEVGGIGRQPRKTIFCSRQCVAAMKKGVALGAYDERAVARTMTATEAAWMAAIIDGEGSIIFNHLDRPMPGIRLSVANTSHELLEAVMRTAGCGTIQNQRPATERHRQSWLWVTFSGNARSLLRQILPYLVAKQLRARIATADRFQYVETETDKRIVNPETGEWVSLKRLDANRRVIYGVGK